MATPARALPTNKRNRRSGALPCLQRGERSCADRTISSRRCLSLPHSSIAAQVSRNSGPTRSRCAAASSDLVGREQRVQRASQQRTAEPRSIQNVQATEKGGRRVPEQAKTSARRYREASLAPVFPNIHSRSLVCSRFGP